MPPYEDLLQRIDELKAMAVAVLGERRLEDEEVALLKQR
jgi:hypothetical protein